MILLATKGEGFTLPKILGPPDDARPRFSLYQTAYMPSMSCEGRILIAHDLVGQAFIDGTELWACSTDVSKYFDPSNSLYCCYLLF